MFSLAHATGVVVILEAVLPLPVETNETMSPQSTIELPTKARGGPPIQSVLIV